MNNQPPQRPKQKTPWEIVLGVLHFLVWTPMVAAATFVFLIAWSLGLTALRLPSGYHEYAPQGSLYLVFAVLLPMALFAFAFARAGRKGRLSETAVQTTLGGVAIALLLWGMCSVSVNW